MYFVPFPSSISVYLIYVFRFCQHQWRWQCGGGRPGYQTVSPPADSPNQGLETCTPSQHLHQEYRSVHVSPIGFHLEAQRWQFQSGLLWHWEFPPKVHGFLRCWHMLRFQIEHNVFRTDLYNMIGSKIRTHCPPSGTIKSKAFNPMSVSSVGRPSPLN